MIFLMLFLQNSFIEFVMQIKSIKITIRNIIVTKRIIDKYKSIHTVVSYPIINEAIYKEGVPIFNLLQKELNKSIEMLNGATKGI